VGTDEHTLAIVESSLFGSVVISLCPVVDGLGQASGYSEVKERSAV
jgi:hypothetical protein